MRSARVTHAAALANYAPITAAAEAAARRLSDAAPGVVDVYPEMIAASCDVISDLALSARDAVNRDLLTRSVNDYVRGAARVSLLDMLGAPAWAPRPGEVIHSSRRRMDRLIGEIVAARRARGPSDPPDFLDLLLAARDPETGRGLDETDLRNNLAGFLFAGPSCGCGSRCVRAMASRSRSRAGNSNRAESYGASGWTETDASHRGEAQTLEKQPPPMTTHYDQGQ